MSDTLWEKLTETLAFIKQHYDKQPEVAIILGSGLGKLTDEIEVEYEIGYEKIPHFRVSTVIGHQGKLLFGKLNNKTVVVMAGRFHYYEGYNPQQITYPIRVMKMLGANYIFISNAAGAVNPSYQVGDLMLIKDHISFFTVNPLIGPNDKKMGVRFPDMSEPYSLALIEKAKAIGEKTGIKLQEGVYTGVTGPTFETRAEYNLIKIAGGDVVGMSTVQEVIVAVHAGMKVFAVSVVTDLGIREEDNLITHEEVLLAARQAEPKLSRLFYEMINYTD